MDLRLLTTFPGEIAGASLKLARLRRRSWRSSAFPGEIAGASLKQAREPDPGAEQAPLVPRRNRRGLIEAEAAPRWRGAPGAGFPGEIAGASLKRVSVTPGRGW